MTDPHLVARGTLIELESPSIGRASYPHASIRLSASPWVTTRAPRLGEHTGAVLGQVLKLTDGEIAVLQRAGVV